MECATGRSTCQRVRVPLCGIRAWRTSQAPRESLQNWRAIACGALRTGNAHRAGAHNYRGARNAVRDISPKSHRPRTKPSTDEAVRRCGRHSGLRRARRGPSCPGRASTARGVLRPASQFRRRGTSGRHAPYQWRYQQHGRRTLDNCGDVRLVRNQCRRSACRRLYVFGMAAVNWAASFSQRSVTVPGAYLMIGRQRPRRMPRLGALLCARRCEDWPSLLLFAIRFPYKKSMDDIDTTIGLRVRIARKAKGLTVAQLAEAIGCAQPQLTRLEKGNEGWSAARLSAVALAVGVPLDLLCPVRAHVPKDRDATKAG